MKRLIITADDFGLTTSINDGIISSVNDGIVTSISMISAGEAFNDAVSLLHRHKILSVGAHLALTEVSPVLPRTLTSSIVTASGKFYRHYINLLPRVFFHLARKHEIYLELKAQIERILKTGIKIDHISSHEHIHIFPGLMEIFIYLSREFNIPSIRYPHKETATSTNSIYKTAILSYLGHNMLRKLSKSGLKHTDHFSGLINSGKLKEDTLSNIIRSLKDGTTELVCHPGRLGPEIESRYPFHKNCELELKALTNPETREVINENAIKLISYSEL
jgi:chitin disaccharide deacetylase